MQIEADGATSDREVFIPRPGHADLAGSRKYGFEDMRNVLERSSARETTTRVAIGAIAKQILKSAGVHLASRVVSIGEIVDDSKVHEKSDFLAAETSSLRMIDSDVELKVKQRIDRASEEGDTLGGVFEVVAWNLPIGLGSYVHWDRKIDGDIGQSFLSLNAIKGVEIGTGFGTSFVSGREAHDQYFSNHGKVAHQSNKAGGLTGGVTTGEPLVVRAAMKPLSTMRSPLQSVDIRTGINTPAHFERSDVCAVPSAAVIGESLLALVIVNRMLEKFGGDSMDEFLARVAKWRESLE
jgi:chorismate synthase